MGTTTEGGLPARDMYEDHVDSDHVYSDKQLVIARTALPGLLSIMGSIDHFNASAVARALEAELLTAAESRDRRLHIDLSRLEFVDTSGIRAIVKVAENAPGRGGLVLHGLPPLMRRVMVLVGWGDGPGLIIDDGGAQDGVHERLMNGG
jgi:anti-anti-sigma factor